MRMGTFVRADGLCPFWKHQEPHLSWLWLTGSSQTEVDNYREPLLWTVWKAPGHMVGYVGVASVKRQREEH